MKALLALAALASLSVPALAKPRSGSWQIGRDMMHIYYEDLDVTSRAGRAVLLARVETAVHRLCRADARNDQDACVAETIAGVGLPALQQAVAERDASRFAAR